MRGHHDHSSGVDTIRLRHHFGRSPLPRPDPTSWYRSGLSWVYTGTKPGWLGYLAVEIWPTGETYVVVECVLPAVLYGKHYASGSLMPAEVAPGMQAVAGWVSDFFGWRSPMTRLVSPDLAGWEVTRVDPSDTWQHATGLLPGLHRVLLSERAGVETVTDFQSSGRTVGVRASKAEQFRAYEKAPVALRDGQADPGSGALRAEWQLRFGGDRVINAADSVAMQSVLRQYGCRTVQLLGKAAVMATQGTRARIDALMSSVPASGKPPTFSEVLRLLSCEALWAEGEDTYLRDSLARRTYYETKSRLRELIEGLPIEVPSDLLGDFQLVLARDLASGRQGSL